MTIDMKARISVTDVLCMESFHSLHKNVVPLLSTLADSRLEGLKVLLFEAKKQRPGIV